MMRNRNTHTVFIRALIFIAIVIAFWRFGVISETLRSIALAAAAPLWRAERALSWTEDTRATFFSSRKRLAEKNRILKEENAFLKARISFEALIAEENRELKEILGRREPKENALLAIILSRPGRSFYDTLVIDAGSDAGVRAGNIVAAYGNAAIGIVKRVHTNTSIVRLFSSYGEKIDALLGAADTPIRAEGDGGGNFHTEVPKDIAAARDDLVTIASREAPLLGIVADVRAAPSDSFQKVLFQTPVNIYELKWVEIMLGTSYPPDDGREE